MLKSLLGNNRPRYAHSNKKRKYQRKRQAANVQISRALSMRYRQPQTLSQSSTYSVRRMYQIGVIMFSNTFQDGLYDFRLVHLPGYTDFTTLYDQYRIDKWVLHFIPASTMTFPASSTDAGTLLTAIDFDGGAVGLTQAQLSEYESLNVTKPFTQKTITLKPRAELDITDSGGAVVQAALSPSATWFDCSNVSVRHYGVRWGATPDTTATTNHQQYNVWFELFITFKSTR